MLHRARVALYGSVRCEAASSPIWVCVRSIGLLIAAGLVVAPRAWAGPDPDRDPRRTPRSTTGSAGRPWVALSFGSSARWSDGFVGSVENDLRAGLARQGVDLARTGGTAGHATRPIARVAVGPAAGSRVSLAIAVRDAVTNKRVSREVDLSGFDDESRSLMLAVAIEELLRASWAELALQSRAPRKPAPPAVVRIVRRSLERVRSERLSTVGFQVCGALAFDYFAGGTALLGGGVSGTLWLFGRFAATLGIGGRQLLPVDAPRGKIGGRGPAARLELVWRAWRRGGFRLDAGAALRWWLLFVEGQPDPQSAALARDSASHVLAAVGLIRPAWRWQRIEIGAGVQIGGVLRGIELVDGDRSVAEISGLSVSVDVGVSLSF